MNVRKAVCSLIIFVSSSVLAGAQGVSLGEFFLGTTGYFPAGSNTPAFVTDGALAVRFLPVDSIRFSARFGFKAGDTADFLSIVANQQESADTFLDSAALEIHEPGGNPYSITVFAGGFDDPVSGSLLRDMLKVELPEPSFFGTVMGSAFSPDTGIDGTGAAFTCAPRGQGSALGMYGYWNGRMDSLSRITWDFRLAGSGSRLAYNAFGGMSMDPAGTQTSLRGGITALLGTGDRNSLYLSAGIRSFIPGTSDLKRDLYFLFEPRISAGFADMAFAFFSSPVFAANTPAYLGIQAESNFLGSNIALSFGDLDRHRIRGGVNALGTINPEQPAALTPFSLSVSPYFSFRVSDFVFDLTAVIKPLLYDDLLRMGELSLSVKAVY